MKMDTTTHEVERPPLAGTLEDKGVQYYGGEMVKVYECITCGTDFISLTTYPALGNRIECNGRVINSCPWCSDGE